MDACSDPSTPEVVVMAGAQLGKTEAILNIIGYHIDYDPSPILVLQPTLDMASAFSKERVANGLLKSTPCLESKVQDPRSRDSGNTTFQKLFPGGSVSMVGANSPASLASRPIRLVLCDEVDRYPTSAGSEGDPIQLAKKRSATFWNRKIVLVSTPTNKGSSRIEDAYEKSDQRHYYIPCKHCEHDQIMKWSNVQWVDNDPSTAKYVCESCGSAWNDADRIWAIRNGHWVASAPFTGVAGFTINGMYSPWTPLSDGVRDFLSVKKNPEQLRVWTNTYLGETWEDAGEQVDDYMLSERREEMESIPDEVVLITAGVDVQDDRLEMSVTGWGRDDESWVISHDVFYGDPSTPQLWSTLDAALLKVYQTESGRDMAIHSTCVDSGGHFTNSVYKYCKRNYGRRVFAIKGRGGEGTPIVTKPSKNNVVKCPLFPVGVDTVKDLLFARLRIDEPGPGYIHFSSVLNDEYFKQLTAEKIVTRFHRGFKKRIFEKIRTRNEALDCFVYSIAAYAIININVNTLADKIEADAGEPVEEAPKTAQLKKPSFVQRPKGSFVNSWR